jgi:hypothetical protein
VFVAALDALPPLAGRRLLDAGCGAALRYVLAVQS